MSQIKAKYVSYTILLKNYGRIITGRIIFWQDNFLAELLPAK